MKVNCLASDGVDACARATPRSAVERGDFEDLMLALPTSARQGSLCRTKLPLQPRRVMISGASRLSRLAIGAQLSWLSRRGSTVGAQPSMRLST